jgi:ABC-type antimicrobial peptide transport system permease subunit
MYVNPSRKRKAADDTSLLNDGLVRKDQKPRLSDGRTARRAPQSHVSVTVRFDALNDLRVKRKEQALPNCWLDSGPQNQKTIEQVRRGDIAMTIMDAVPFSAETGLTNSATVFVNLNNWSKNIPIRVVGIVENPSVGRGQADAKDCYGNIQVRGVNTINNQGKYTLVAGDHVYALMIPEIVDINGTIWSMNAIKGTGDGSGSHQDYNQKLVPQIIPLKHKDIKQTLETMRHEVDERINVTWNRQLDEISVMDIWSGFYIDLRSHLRPDKICLIPGMEQYCIFYFVMKSMERALRDLYNGVDYLATQKLIKIIYTEGHKEIKSYWRETEKYLSALSNPDDLRRLGRGTGEWLVPVGILSIRNATKQVISADIDLKDLNKTFKSKEGLLRSQIEEVKQSSYEFIQTFIRILSFTLGWIESNDITQFMESCYVGMVTSAQCGPGQNFDMVR